MRTSFRGVDSECHSSERRRPGHHAWALSRYTLHVIIRTHFRFFSQNQPADRTFFRDVLGFPSVDAGDQWFIFSMPAAEAAIHPANGEMTQHQAGHRLLGAVLYLMCDDLDEYISWLNDKNIRCSEVQTAPWGTIPLPSEAAIGLYRPTHATALDLDRSATQ
jgi:hypothetical protein